MEAKVKFGIIIAIIHLFSRKLLIYIGFAVAKVLNGNQLNFVETAQVLQTMPSIVFLFKVFIMTNKF